MTTPTLCRVCGDPRGECAAADCAEHTIPGLCVYCCKIAAADALCECSRCVCPVQNTGYHVSDCHGGDICPVHAGREIVR